MGNLKNLVYIAQDAAYKMKQAVKAEGITDAESLNTFLGSLNRMDNIGLEYTNSPLRTYLRGVGDAEDVAVLGYALAKHAGLKPKIGIRDGRYIVLRIDGQDVLQKWRKNNSEG